MRNLLYYDPSLVGDDKGQTSMREFKASVEKAGENGPKYQLRDATQWRGEVEVSENRYPGRVLLASGGANESLFAKLRKAYETVGVPVSDVSVEGPFGPFDAEAGEDGGDIDTLRAEATALGVPFTGDTDANALRGLVADATRQKQAAEASLSAGRGDAVTTNDIVNRVNARVGAGDATARAGNLDPANMATSGEDGITLTDDAGRQAGEPGDDRQGGDDTRTDAQRLDDLKAEADELGVEYAPNIGYDTLSERVAAAKADKDGEDGA